MRRKHWRQLGFISTRKWVFIPVVILILIIGFYFTKTLEIQNAVLIDEEVKVWRLEGELPSKELNRDELHVGDVTDGSCDTVHVAIVCAGYDASREVITLIKSILFHRRSPMHVHFIVDKTAKKILSTLFRTWALPDFVVSFYPGSTLEQKVSWIPNFHYSGVYGLLKLVITDVLPPEIEHVIILDVDIVAMGDLGELWKYFSQFESKNAIGLVENQSEWYLGKISRSKPWPALGHGFNTGVMLVNRFRLMDLNWDVMWSDVTRDTLKSFNGTILADQDIINAVVKKNPTILFRLPCTWNVQLSQNTNSVLCFQNDLSRIELLHWNAPGRLKTRKVPSYLFQYFHSFTIYDGGLLRNPVLRCHNVIEDFSEEVSSYEDDLCKIMLNNVLQPRRVHFFYFSYSYIAVNTCDVTLVTQLSLNRITMLDMVANHWSGPISVAFYISDFETVKLERYVVNSAVLSSRKNIAYHLVFENAGDITYPVNLLRNVALQQAGTDFIFLSDVDFIPSKDLYEYLIGSILPSIHVDSKTAVIVPAFESFYYKQNFPQTKSELVQQWSEGAITPFRSYIWSAGHNATDFVKWRHAREIYSVKWEKNFEPYVVISKKVCPPYDKRFYGFGWNKVSHVMHLEALGFQFNVVPYGFVVHMPHAPSADIIKFRSSSEYRKCSDHLKSEFVEDLVEKYNIDREKFLIT